MSQNVHKLTNSEIDLRGFTCPLPVLKLRKRLSHIKPPFCVRVLSDDPMTAIDIPAFCQETQYRCLEKGTCHVNKCLYFVIMSPHTDSLSQCPSS